MPISNPQKDQTHGGSEVFENLQSRFGNDDVRQAKGTARCSQTPNGDAALVGSFEECRRLLLTGHLEEGPAEHVYVGVGGRKDEKEDAAIDETRKHLDAGYLNRHNERTGRGI